MQTVFINYIYLILIILAMVMLANRLRVAYPIVLVLGGLALSSVKAFAHIVIDPQLVFFIFLPPLLYEAAWQTSWKDLWRWRRIITSFAFPIVIITSCVVAFASNAIIPGFTLALGFLLGGIISPPDAVSATTIMRQVKVPRALISIIEGESLLNDAASLIVFRFALAAVVTGQFHFGEVTVSFFLVIIMGVAIGLAVGFLFYVIHRWLPTTPSIEIVLTLVTPYCMYYAAEYFHFSGVLAVVSGGLLLSNQRRTMLSYQGRVEGVNVWSSIVFVLNGLIFLLIGLQLPIIVSQLDISVAAAAGYGLAIAGILILSRFACTFGAVLFTRIASHFITVADPNPGWKAPLITGWAGMRGVVSLAAALSIPLITEQGQSFPQRNLILFITFIVILVTLVLQGLTLPWLVHKLDMKDKYSTIPGHRQEMIIQKKMAQVSRDYLQQQYPASTGNGHIDNLLQRLELDLAFFERYIDQTNTSNDNVNTTNGAGNNTSTDALSETTGEHNPVIPRHSLSQFHQVYLKLLDEQRQLLDKMNHKAEFDEELIRKYLTLIDLEELKIREKGDLKI